jgi:hypothetical protein
MYLIISCSRICVAPTAGEAVRESGESGLGTQGSPKRKMRELFELLNVAPWKGRELTVAFTSEASSNVARSLGTFRRWASQTTCTEQSLDDFVQRMVNVNVLADSGIAVAWRRPAATRKGPTNRLLADTFFLHSFDSAKRRCLLCSKVYKQNSAKRNTNVVNHLQFKHEDNIAAFRQRRTAQ